eukprot:TRINITY_DN9144_c0_g1_i4.p1 TRINITY_DN9144_c0_g1~~TRINITY_DN9144_c0_g1_i4.p1  ORF type:complete len:528 (+),score=71.97 TRINITY_DN9144_c0_g1_i4:110-1693(+)
MASLWQPLCCVLGTAACVAWIVLLAFGAMYTANSEREDSEGRRERCLVVGSSYGTCRYSCACGGYGGCSSCDGWSVTPTAFVCPRAGQCSVATVLANRGKAAPACGAVLSRGPDENCGAYQCRGDAAISIGCFAGLTCPWNTQGVVTVSPHGDRTCAGTCAMDGHTLAVTRGGACMCADEIPLGCMPSLCRLGSFNVTSTQCRSYHRMEFGQEIDCWVKNTCDEFDTSAADYTTGAALLGVFGVCFILSIFSLCAATEVSWFETVDAFKRACRLQPGPEGIEAPRIIKTAGGGLSLMSVVMVVSVAIFNDSLFHRESGSTDNIESIGLLSSVGRPLGNWTETQTLVTASTDVLHCGSALQHIRCMQGLAWAAVGLRILSCVAFMRLLYIIVLVQVVLRLTAATLDVAFLSFHVGLYSRSLCDMSFKDRNLKLGWGLYAILVSIGAEIAVIVLPFWLRAQRRRRRGSLARSDVRVHASSASPQSSPAVSLEMTPAAAADPQPPVAVVTEVSQHSSVKGMQLEEEEPRQ